MVKFDANFLAETELVYTDGGILAEYAWSLVVLPFVAAFLITFIGKYLPYKGAEIALGTIALISVSYTHLTLPTKA